MKNNVFACILAAAHFDSQTVQILGIFGITGWNGRMMADGMLGWISSTYITWYDTTYTMWRWMIRVPHWSKSSCGPQKTSGEYTNVGAPRPQGFQLLPLAFGVQSLQRPCQPIGNLPRHVSQLHVFFWQVWGVWPWETGKKHWMFLLLMVQKSG